MSGVNVNLDALLTGTQAARLAGVSKQVIYRWRQLGHLHPAQQSPPRYRAGDVLAAERVTRNSPYCRRAG